MGKGPIVFILLLILGIGGYLALDMISAKKAGSVPGGSSSQESVGPGPNDKVLVAGSTADVVMSAVTGFKKFEDQRAEAKSWTGQWLPTEGWQGTVEKISAPTMGSGKIMRFTVTTGVGMAQSFIINAHLDDGQEYYKGTEISPRTMVTFGGKLEEIVIMEPNSYNPLPQYALNIKKAYVMQVNGN